MESTGRHVLVTGASRGLGLEMTRALAQDGWTVFAGVRSPADLQRLSAISPLIVPLSLDVTDGGQIAEAVRTVSERTDRLDGLVKNAGIFLPGSFELLPTKDLIESFRVNVFGLVAITQALLPLIRRARGRIVLISSANGRISVPGTSAYSASKFALTALADAMRLELQPWGILTVLVEPGALATDIRVRGFEQWQARERALPGPQRELYAPLLAKWKAMLDAGESSVGAPEHAVSAVREALTSPSPKTRYLAVPNAEQLAALIALADEERDHALGKMFG